MADLMPEEKWLVKYCMESEENARLALRIAQIGPDLEVAIVRSFLEKLAESVDKELGKGSLDSHWKRGEMEEDRFDPRRMIWRMELPMIRDGKITLKFGYEVHQPTNGRPEGGGWYLGVPLECQKYPEADCILPDLEHLGASRGENHKDWHWWFYPREDHKDLEDLATLHDDQVRRAKIEYFTYLLAGSAKAISRALGDVEA